MTAIETTMLVALFFISIPLHELGHLLFLIALGNSAKDFEVRWFNFLGRASVKLKQGSIKLPKIFRNYLNLVLFLVGLSGGLGAAILLLIGFFLTPLVPELTKPLSCIILTQLVYAVGEGLSLFNLEVEEAKR